MSSARSSKNTVWASAKETPCLRLLAESFWSSHSNDSSRTNQCNYIVVMKSKADAYVPLTMRLGGALQAYRHLRGPRVLAQADGTSFTPKMVADHVRRVARRASVVPDGVHVLRHTFCSHLAMRRAPARAIQELAGHKDLSTTQRYMHLSPAALTQAIRLLDGDILETTFASSGKSLE
jgi:site-specific recombinase XerD